MKYLVFILLYIAVDSQLAYGESKDSLHRTSCYLLFGTYAFTFNNDLYTTQTPTSSFINNQINPFECYTLGAKIEHPVSSRKKLSSSVLYSNSKIGYLYSSTTFPNGRYERTGKIQMNAIMLSTCLKYRLSKSVGINYGLSHYFNVKNRFDNDSIARTIGWNNSENKSNFKFYTCSLAIGIEVKIYKRISLEVSFMRGINNSIELQFIGDNKSRTPQKLRYAGLSIDYKLN